MEEVLQLLKLWKDFIDEGNSPDFHFFAKWIGDKDLRNRKENSTSQFKSDIDALIGFYLGNILSFAEVWTKLSLRDLPIIGFSDYGILNFVKKKGTPSKKEIAEYYIGESSTSFETIKRLTKNNLIEEFTDTNDKRVKRVKLTKKGDSTANEALNQAVKLSKLLVGNLTTDEKAQLVEILEKLFNFHYKLYHNSHKNDVIKTYNL